jgi:hypothetical protein
MEGRVANQGPSDGRPAWQAWPGPWSEGRRGRGHQLTAWHGTHQKPASRTASPQEVGDYPAKASGRGHQVRPGGSGGQGEQVGHKPGLGEDENLQGLDPLLEGLQPPCPPGPKGPLYTREDMVPRELYREGEDGGDNKPKGP